MANPTLTNPVHSPKNNGTTETTKGTENHLTAANHLENAAKHHKEAAKHHENGDHEKAALSTIKAHGHVAVATDAQRKDAKEHAENN